MIPMTGQPPLIILACQVLRWDQLLWMDVSATGNSRNERKEWWRFNSQDS